MYLWLKLDAKKKLQDSMDQEIVEGMQIKTDHVSRREYLITRTEVSDPIIEIADELNKLVERVTARDRIFRALRTEGVYHHDGATLTAKTEIKIRDFSEEVSQVVNISGPSVETVKTIYTLFRQGDLTPEENWEKIESSDTETDDEAGDSSV